MPDLSLRTQSCGDNEFQSGARSQSAALERLAFSQNKIITQRIIVLRALCPYAQPPTRRHHSQTFRLDPGAATNVIFAYKMDARRPGQKRNQNMMTDLHVVPARRGRAVRLAKGQAIQIINTHGQQVVDTWCFNADDMSEFMSMEHLHATLQGIFPATGDGLATNRRRPILILEEDTSPGRHDTVIAACDVHRYAALGCTQYHDNCTDNLRAALGQLDLRTADCPAPLNLWMNIPVGPDGKITWGEPLSKPGDRVTLRAVLDCIVVMSTCPQDMIPINGAACTPTEVHYRLMP
ncbi:urea carboxylase-associated family protein [Frigidibacter sp.]|uniref:urea carboxylase-associated family protein n=1 Tax=Frigidibacter sp. TaxID=2586418 RepID=UPI0027357EDF|nr:urea carboxylase-associated family protein [Frigidibacter sp.]MDP3342339.1 urea carboxylase-associated family protein [Frigidibacter sp.]